MELQDIIKDERKKINIEKIEMPTQQDGKEKENEPKETPAEVMKEIPVAQLATMAIGAYNVISCAIYRRFEPGFDASLTNDEVAALQQPTEQFFEQYNVTMTPTVALIIAIVGVNMVKIMQLRAYRAAQEKDGEKAEKKQ